MSVKYSKSASADLQAFQKKYPTRIGKERALSKMTDKQIDRLIAGCSTAQGKMFYARHKSGGKK